MIKAKINQKEFEVDVVSDTEVILNSELKKLDIISLSKEKQHVIIDNKSYSIEFVEFDSEKKIATLKVNNNSYEVAIQDKYDMLLKDLGMNNMTSKVIKEIKAPMPGLVVSIEVEVGQEVSEGDSVLILEAMKMENVLKSPVDGKIKSIKTKQTQTVEKNEILIEFE